MYRVIELTKVPMTIGLFTASNVIDTLSQGLMFLNVAFLLRGQRPKGQSSSGIVRTPDTIAHRNFHQSSRSSHCMSIAFLIHSRVFPQEKNSFFNLKPIHLAICFLIYWYAFQFLTWDEKCLDFEGRIIQRIDHIGLVARALHKNACCPHWILALLCGLYIVLT